MAASVFMHWRHGPRLVALTDCSAICRSTSMQLIRSACTRSRSRIIWRGRSMFHVEHDVQPGQGQNRRVIAGRDIGSSSSSIA
jgi:hypothetical protein